MQKPKFIVFTKMWNLPLRELAEHVSKLGFDGVELAVRDGYAVTPDNIEQELPRAVSILADYGLEIGTIAGPFDRQICDDKTLSAFAASGVRIMRVCARMNPGEPYLVGEARLQREFESMTPLLAKHGVTLGVQNHYDMGTKDICNAMCLRHLVERFDPKQIGIVWDAGHNGLEGETPEMGLDIVWSHLAMVNLKSAYWRRTNGPEAPFAEWETFWTTGRHGRANWPRVAAELERRDYKGMICFPAEYTDEPSVDRLITEDIAFARTLFPTE